MISPEHLRSPQRPERLETCRRLDDAMCDGDLELANVLMAIHLGICVGRAALADVLTGTRVVLGPKPEGQD